MQCVAGVLGACQVARLSYHRIVVQRFEEIKQQRQEEEERLRQIDQEEEERRRQREEEQRRLREEREELESVMEGVLCGVEAAFEEERRFETEELNSLKGDILRWVAHRKHTF